MTHEPPPEDEYKYPYWNRVYLTVVIYTIALIGALWMIGSALSK